MMLRASIVVPALASLLALLPGRLLAGEDLHAVTATPASAKAGSRGTAHITLQAKNGWHLNEEAPISVKLKPAAGVTVEKAKLARKDIAQATQDEARFDVAFTATEPGPKTIDAEARYVICQDTACKQVQGTTTVKLNIEADKPQPTKGKGIKAKGKGKTPRAKKSAKDTAKQTG